MMSNGTLFEHILGLHVLQEYKTSLSQFLHSISQSFIEQIKFRGGKHAWYAIGSKLFLLWFKCSAWLCPRPGPAKQDLPTPFHVCKHITVEPACKVLGFVQQKLTIQEGFCCLTLQPSIIIKNMVIWDLLELTLHPF